MKAELASVSNGYMTLQVTDDDGGFVNIDKILSAEVVECINGILPKDDKEVEVSEANPTQAPEAEVETVQGEEPDTTKDSLTDSVSSEAVHNDTDTIQTT